MCGADREEALALLRALEALTAAPQPSPDVDPPA